MQLSQCTRLSIFAGFLISLSSIVNADNIYLKIDDVQGESIDREHFGEIAVAAWSFGASQSGSLHLGGGGGAGKANVQDLSITKWVDTATTELMMALLNGKQFKQAVLTIQRTDSSGLGPIDYFRMTMSDVIITSQSTGGAAGETGPLAENVTLNFARFCTQYLQTLSDGTPGKRTLACYDIQANASL